MPGELLVITSSCRRGYDLFRRREFQDKVGSGSAVCQFQLRKLCGLHTFVVALKFDLHPRPQKLAGPPIRLKSVNRITAPTFFAVSISYKKRPPTIDFRD
jgi:hypothetical protein